MSTTDASAGGAAGPVDCREALARLFDFLDSEMGDADADRIREHLAGCEECLTEYDIEDHLKKLVRRSCTDCAPVELHVRVREQLTLLRTRPQG